MKKVLISLGLLAALLLAALPTTLAQEELSPEEQQVQFERAVAALQTYYGYNSYTINVYEAHSQTTNISMSETNQESSKSEELTGTFNVIRDSQNISGTFTIVATMTEGEVTREYTVEGEMRYVDGALYINAAYTSGGDDPNAVPLPEGWTEIEDVKSDPVLSILDPSNTIENFDPVKQQENVEMFQSLGENALSVTVEPDAMSDGTEVELITISLDKAALMTMMASSEEVAPETVALFELLPEDEEVAALLIAIDAEGNARGVVQALELNFVDVDLATVMEGAPEGSTFSLSQQQVEAQEFTAINPELEPVTVPE